MMHVASSTIISAGDSVAITLETSVKATISEKEVHENIISIVAPLTATMSNQCMVQGATTTMEQTICKIVKQVSNDICKLVKQVEVLAIIWPASSIGKRDQKTWKDSTSIITGWHWFDIILCLKYLVHSIIDVVQFLLVAYLKCNWLITEGNIIECILGHARVGQFVCPIPGLGGVIYWWLHGSKSGLLPNVIIFQLTQGVVY